MTNPTPMTREQAWETVDDALQEFWDVAIGAVAPDKEQDKPRADAAFDALAFLRTEMERLEGERDVAIHAASLVENPEYVAALQQAGVEYVEQLVARIAELEAENAKLREQGDTLIQWCIDHDIGLPDGTWTVYSPLRFAALPDTEGQQYPVRGAFLGFVRPDTEGEQE